MIEKYYATHIKDRIDAAAINVRRSPKGTRRTRALGKLDGKAEP